MPSSAEEWLQVANEFERKWNFPHCIGALDGKHIEIFPPANSGSLYFNYKHFSSIVLLALVDASYRVLYVDIGSYGSLSDGGVFNNSTLYNALENNSLQRPEPALVSGTKIVLPYFIIADDAFPLKKYLLKPYGQKNLSREQRIFNYRLSRSRRTVENFFGHISQRFRVLKQAIMLSPEKVEIITLAICCLHNITFYCATKQHKLIISNKIKVKKSNVT